MSVSNVNVYFFITELQTAEIGFGTYLVRREDAEFSSRLVEGKCS